MFMCICFVHECNPESQINSAKFSSLFLIYCKDVDYNCILCTRWLGFRRKRLVLILYFVNIFFHLFGKCTLEFVTGPRPKEEYFSIVVKDFFYYCLPLKEHGYILQ